MKEYSNEDKTIIGSSGRSTLEEMLGDITMMQCSINGYDLDFSNPSNITISEDADSTSASLVRMLNAQALQPEKIAELKASYTLLRDFHSKGPHCQPSDNIYFMWETYSKECTEIAEGTILNPKEFLKGFIDSYLRKKGCRTIYNPYSGVGSLRYLSLEYGEESGLDYVFQEPSPLLCTMSQVLSGDCSLGDFHNNWLGDGCDGFVSILPDDYVVEGDDAAAEKGRKRASLILEKLAGEHNFKAAIVIAKKDVLTHKSTTAVRKTLIESKHLERVITLDYHCLSQNAKDFVMLCFDFREGKKNVRISSVNYLYSMSSVMESPYCQDNEHQSEIFDWVTYYDKVVPNEYISDNDYNLSYDVYNVPSILSFPNETALYHYDDLDHEFLQDKQEFDSDKFDFIPLGELITQIEPDKGVTACEGDVIAMADSYHMTYDKVIHGKKRIMSSMRIGFFQKSKIYRGETLSISHLGVFYNNTGRNLVAGKSYPVFRIMSEKIDAKYLIAMLADPVIKIRDVYPYIMNWRVPVIKGGIEAQKAYVEEHFPENRKTYTILTLGKTAKELDWKKNGYKVLEHFESIPNNLKSRVIGMKAALDAIVIGSDTDYNDDKCEGVYELYDMKLPVPFFIVNRSLDDDKICAWPTKPGREELKNALIRIDGSSSHFNILRTKLAERESPEYKVREEYKEYLEQATAIDNKWNDTEIKVHDFLLKFLIECKKEDSSFPEKSFADFRGIRDFILRKIADTGAVHAFEDEGAIAALLADRVYKVSDNEVYYQLNSLKMPHVLAEGIRFIGNISNEAIHQSVGTRELAMSLSNILLYFIDWTKARIDDGFFDSQYIGYCDEASSFRSSHEFETGEQKEKVSLTYRNGKKYWYCGNVHLEEKNKMNRKLQVGQTIKINSKSIQAEKQPFITDEVQCIYYAKDNWE